MNNDKLVFISHRNQDTLYSLLIGYFLESKGIPCFDFIVDQYQNVAKDHVENEYRILDQNAFACIVLISKKSLNPKTAGQILNEFTSAYQKYLLKRPNFHLIPIFKDIDFKKAINIKNSWIYQNIRYREFFTNTVGLSTPKDISKWKTIENFNKWDMEIKNNDSAFRMSFWGHLLRTIEAYMSDEQLRNRTVNKERLEDFEHKIKEILQNKISHWPLLDWFPKNRFLSVGLIIGMLVLTGILFTKSEDKHIFPKISSGSNSSFHENENKIKIFSITGPTNMINSFHENENILTVSCDERFGFLSLRVLAAGIYNLFFISPPGCKAGVRVEVENVPVNLTGANIHGEARDYFMIEKGPFIIQALQNDSIVRLQFFNLGEAKVKIKFQNSLGTSIDMAGCDGFGNFEHQKLQVEDDNTVHINAINLTTYSGWSKPMRFPVTNDSVIMVAINGVNSIVGNKFLKIYTSVDGRDVSLICTDSSYQSDDPDYIFAGDGTFAFKFRNSVVQNGFANKLGFCFAEGINISNVRLKFYFQQ